MTAGLVNTNGNLHRPSDVKIQLTNVRSAVALLDNVQ